MKNMNKVFVVISVIILNHTFVLGQKVKPVVDTFFKPNYPEGIYKTKDDFNKKTPSGTSKLIPKRLYGIPKPVLENIEHNCFFYNAETDKKIKKVFAVSYRGHLYFKIGAILKYRNKTDRAQSNDNPNSFVRVILGGNNYLYTEAPLANAWAQAFAYGAIGGGVGSVLASTMTYGKGIVWDFKNNEFNIFKNCEDYNEFIIDKSKDDVQNCEEAQLDVLKIRSAINKIK